MTWFPGQEFGHALSDVLLGRSEPGARVPTVWPAHEHGPIPTVRPTDGVLRCDESIHVGQRGYDRAGVAPAFPLGHRLGYTRWRYDGVDDPTIVGGDVTLRVRLRNTGDRPGREVVQVYASRPDSAIDRPVRWLAGFAVVDADAGGEVITTVTVPRRALQHWDTAAAAWRTEPGTFVLEVGSSSADRHLTTTIAMS
jgi:beta-glucosidase